MARRTRVDVRRLASAVVSMGQIRPSNCSSSRSFSLKAIGVNIGRLSRRRCRRGRRGWKPASKMRTNFGHCPPMPARYYRFDLWIIRTSAKGREVAWPMTVDPRHGGRPVTRAVGRTVTALSSIAGFRCAHGPPDDDRARP